MDQRVTPIVVKLGGSTITIKEKEATPNHRAIMRLVQEIAAAQQASMILVHGGGSFGHPPARKYQLMQGHQREEQLLGVSKTRQAMMAINKIVIDSFLQNSTPAVAIQPSACIITRNKRIHEFYTRPINQLLMLGITPILFGDVVLDLATGFTILSGDQVLAELAIRFDTEEVILGVDVDGLFTENPKVNPHATLIHELTLPCLKKTIERIGEATSIDVTGGMYGKMVELIPVIEHGIKVTIVNALKANRLRRALQGEPVVGTTITRR